MKDWMIYALVALIVAGLAWFGYKKTVEVTSIEKDNFYADSLQNEKARWLKRLSDCEKAKIPNPISTPVYTVRQKLSHDDSVKIARFMAYATQGQFDSLLAVIERLSATRSGTRGFTYEDDNLLITGTSVAISRPLESDTIHVQTWFDEFQVKDLPHDIVHIFVDKPASKSFIEGVVLRTDWNFLVKRKKSEVGASIAVPINIGNIRILPNAGYHSYLKVNGGVGIEYAF